MQVWCLTWHASGRRASDASLRSQAAACRCETAPAGSFLGVTAMGSGSQCQGSRNEVSPAGVAQRHAGCGSGWGGNPPAPWHCARQSVLVLTVSYSSSKLLVCDAQGKLRIAEDEGCKIVLADSAWHRRQLSTDMPPQQPPRVPERLQPSPHAHPSAFSLLSVEAPPRVQEGCHHPMTTVPDVCTSLRCAA